MSLKTLFLKEHVSGESSKIDTQIFIMYDPSVETYFYYGTRNYDNNSDYVTYQGEFHYSRFDSLVNMLEYIFDGFCEVVTHELHDIPIRDREYDSLNFNRLSKKISRKTELAAYDKKNIMKEDVANFLDILVSHEI
jgi:hypothetical protein